MPYEFKLPDIGEGVVEGEIVRWLVNEGDVLREDQPMVEIMTDKATVEIPSPRAGRVARRMFAEGQACRVGQTLIEIEEGSATPTVATPVPVSAGRAAVAERVISTPAAPRPLVTSESKSQGAVLATPATRKLAHELDVPLEAVRGTGPGGRITSDDVRAHAGAAPATTATPRGRAAGGGQPPVASVPAPLARPVAQPVPPGEGDVRIPFRGLRRKIAENMLRSRREAAHFTYVEEIDCTTLVDLRQKANVRLAAQGVKLSFLPFIIKAVVDGLKRFPQMNAYLDEKSSEIVQRREYHIGLASATDDGLVVPVVRHADRLSLVGIAKEIDRLAAATKAGKASREDLSGSTFTITSLGALGGVLATPILNFPEVAILGIHKIARRPSVVEDKVVVRDLMNLSISVDHRLVDGYDAARFVASIKDSLESPALLFLDAV